MNSSEMFDAFHSEMVFKGSELVVDGEIYRYMNDAYVQFARLIGGITDFTSSATELDIEAGEAIVELHPSILRIARVTRGSDGGEIKVVNYPEVERFSNEQGPVEQLMIGTELNKARWISTPAENDTAHLIIHRLPLQKITGPNQRFADVDERHHLAFLDWMKYHAFKRPGNKYFDPQLSAAYASEFNIYCNRVRMEMDRYKHKVRTVAYGGI